jgi:hypothetical protein
MGAKCAHYTRIKEIVTGSSSAKYFEKKELQVTSPPAQAGVQIQSALILDRGVI